MNNYLANPLYVQSLSDMMYGFPFLLLLTVLLNLVAWEAVPLFTRRHASWMLRCVYATIAVIPSMIMDYTLHSYGVAQSGTTPFSGSTSAAGLTPMGTSCSRLSSWASFRRSSS